MSEENLVETVFEDVVVRVEALTYDGRVLNKDGTINLDNLDDVNAVWRYYTVLHGPEELVKRWLLDSPYKLRVVVRPNYTLGEIRRRLRSAVPEAKHLGSKEWFSGVAFDGAKKMPEMGISKPMTFVEQWRNF